MMRRFRIGATGLSCLAGLALLAGVARAEPVMLRYAAAWAGLPAGEVHLRFDDSGQGYLTAIDIDTHGLPQLLTHFRARSESRGGWLADAIPQPEAYDVAYDLRRKHKVVALRYAPSGEGQLARRSAGDTSTHPELPELMRRDTVDPLAMLTEIRRLAGRGLKPGERFLIAVYDGKRRIDVEGHRAMAADPGTLRIRLLARPLAGFRTPHSDEEDPEDSPRPAEIVLSDDQRLIPLNASVSIAHLPLTITLIADCSRTACPEQRP